MKVPGADDSTPTWPQLPFEPWRASKITLHLFCQIVGKVRLALQPKMSHWWHVTLYLSPRGLTTGAMPHGDRTCELELDLTAHTLELSVSDGRRRSFPLAGQSVASFHAELMGNLRDLGLPVAIVGKPFDPERVESDVPFAEDHAHADYDPEAVHRFWRVLSLIEPVFQEFRGWFLGKVSPVHFFWHSLDLAVTRFSGRSAPAADGADPVTREAYSHEVISSGFWAGDANVPFPAFYTYAAPEPAGLAEEPLAPAAAWWERLDGGTHMGMLRYDDLLATPEPRRALLDFLGSSYRAGARRAGWDQGALERV